MALRSGTKLGPYEILAPIGAGGMGEVYRALDPRLNRVVAIKVSAAQFSARFEREAKAIAALNHPHICQVYDIGPDYLVMEFIEGATLAGPLSPPAALRYAEQIADALSAAHAKGITHRDLKPANILVTASGIKLLDFGLALLNHQGGAGADDATATVGLTQAGTIVGTAAYMSPEQAQGNAVDARSDVFSFGLVFYELLSGHRAFSGDSAIAVMAAILHREPAPLTVPPVLHHILDRCLRKSPAERFQSTVQLKEALAAASGAISSPGAWPPQPEMHGAPPERAPSIAVLPFANMSRDQEDEYFSDGLAEEIINALTQVPELKVIARTSAFAFKGKNEDVRKIAETLGVSSILEGSVRRAGPKVRITAQLISAQDGAHLWSQRYEREMTDVFAIQDEISAAIVKQLQVNLTGHSLVKRAATDVAAYEATLEGRYNLTKYTPPANERARQCFERAIELDPHYAPAYAGLGEYHVWQAGLGSATPLQAFPLGRQAALRALELDPQLPEAHAVAGQICAQLDYDWTASERHYLRAIATNPASAPVRFSYGYWCLRPMGRIAETFSEVERAQELDPLSQMCGVIRAYLLSFAKRYDEAVAVAKSTVAMDPSNSLAQLVLGYVLACQGAFEEALAAAERGLDIYGRFPLALAWAGGVYALAGRKDSAREILREVEGLSSQTFSPAGALTVVNCALGDLDAAARWAELAIEQRDPLVIGLKTTPLFENFRSHPSYPALLRRMNLT